MEHVNIVPPLLIL